ncbi:Zona pellucida sperm-binding protein 3 [Acipenser ruthenus]|uniref:Zona pellucida sperm-binding protein 3 n=1 Tax=Acipenser ruthenus TaxID=7906 RepID=A0A444V0E4_ACIRT|nr:Zona pellucida sperm-binding protein 3 [Acipenser ruthenus]
MALRFERRCSWAGDWMAQKRLTMELLHKNRKVERLRESPEQAIRVADDYFGHSSFVSFSREGWSRVAFSQSGGRAVLPQTLSVKCWEDKVVGSVKRDLFGIGQLIKASDVSLGSCVVTRLDDASQSVIFEAPLQECGSTLTEGHSTTAGARVEKERALEAGERSGGRASLLVQAERRGRVGV